MQKEIGKKLNFDEVQNCNYVPIQGGNNIWKKSK